MIQGDPSRAVYPALIGAAIMLVSALALFASPYVSYRVASGQVFEGASGVMSGWMAALTGMAVEVAGVRHAAGLERQAQTTHAYGAYTSEVTRAGAALEAGNLGVQARKLAALAGAGRPDSHAWTDMRSAHPSHSADAGRPVVRSELSRSYGCVGEE
jgi:hypothetical protein